MKLRHLKSIRVAVSLIIFLFLLLVFLGITATVVESVSRVFLRLQLFPSFMRFLALFFSVSALGFVFVLLLTFLFGRVYCSSICPLGTLQDIFIRVSRRFRKKKKRKFVYSSNRNLWMRYGILSATILLWVFGSLFLLNLLDPYSNFGKISVSFFQPVFIWLNNQTAFLLESMDIYAVRPMEVKTLPLYVGMVSGAILLTLVIMTAWRGRLFCNTLCPAGSTLGLIASRSLYRLTFKDEACTLCGKCERACKAECLNSKTKIIDHGRCVSCFNCLTACSNEGLHYQPYPVFESKKTAANDITGKRQFLLTLGAGILSAPLLQRKSRAQGASEPGMIPTGTEYPIIPPGAISYDHFTKNCIACYLCVSACPKNVIVPSFFDFGMEGFMQPKLDYHKSFCNFDCVKCTEVCPTGAITRQTMEQKQVIQIGVARFMVESCIVTVDRTDCGACSEHCPTKAVQMVPYEGLFLPEVEPDLCVGCGACEYACPTEPYKAIYVESNLVHKESIPIEESEGPQQVEQDDFPF
jgi:ferredoxin